MVKLLEKSFENHTGNPKHKTDRDVYNAVLDDLVEYGMRPPVKKYNPILLTHTYGWEKEHEAK